MGTDVKSTLDVAVKVVERETAIGVGSATSQLVHALAFALAMANGTGSNQSDSVHSGTLSISSATTLDTRGGLTSVLTGAAINFAEITWLILVNKSATSGEYLTIGGGSNPVTTMWASSGDAAKIGPGGVLILGSPIDGFATTAGTGDIITITPATGTIELDYILIGRSA